MGDLVLWSHQYRFLLWKEKTHKSSKQHLSVFAGKRKRDDTSILCLVKDMLRLEEEERRQSHAHFESLLDLLREQTEREAEENEQLRAEAAEARHQQAAFMEGLLTTINRLAAGTQGLRHPEVD